MLVTCVSRSLNPDKKSYAVVELEALKVKYAVEKCRYYILGMQMFTVWSDHRPLVGIWRKQINEMGNAQPQPRTLLGPTRSRQRLLLCNQPNARMT
jgi:hypothetical protein